MSVPLTNRESTIIQFTFGLDEVELEDSERLKSASKILKDFWGFWALTYQISRLKEVSKWEIIQLNLKSRVVRS